jgi:hypothetical protein
VLPLLLRLQKQSCQPTQILLAHCLVHCGSSFYPLSVVVSGVRPPVCLLLHVTQNHVLNRSRHPWHFPWYVRFPTSPCFSEVLHDCLCLVCLDSFRHHVHDVFHHCSSQLKIVVRFGSLFGNHLDQSFGMSALKLSGKQVAEPAFKQGNNASEEKEPDSPAWGPNSDTGSFSDRSSIKPVVNNMFDILTHSDLSHNSILVPINASKLSQMRIKILQSIIKLKRINISQPILYITIHYEFDHSENLSTEVKGVTETRFLALLGCESLDWLQVEVVVKMQVVEVLAVNQQH